MAWADFSEKIVLGSSYARSLYSHYTDGPPRLLSASFTVTNRCNLRCGYCNFPYLDRRELDLGQIDLLFSRLRDLGVRRLGLLGGEPLVRADLGEIVQMAKRRAFVVSLNTNLTLYARNPGPVLSADYVFTSLDGDERAHLANRGPRSADGVVDAIADLCRRGRPVVAICVLTGENLDQVDGLLDQADRLGFKVHFQPQCVDAEVTRGTMENVDNEAMRRVWRRLLEAKRGGRPIASSAPYLKFLSEWDDFSVTARPNPATRCAAGSGFLYVDAQGRAHPCIIVKGRAPSIDLLSDDWSRPAPETLPCQTCIVGPMLEFNLLFQQPWSAARSLVRAYG